MYLMLDEMIKKHGLKITAIAHAGGHLGEEAPMYAKCGLRGPRNVWFDCNPVTMDALRQNVAPFGHRVIEACLTDTDGGTTIFNVMNNNMSSSIYPLGTHSRFSPEAVYVDQLTLPTRTIDSLMKEHGFDGINFLNMDLQGAELLVLKGATEFLKQVDVVYSEFSLEEIYVGIPLQAELNAYLAQFGFKVVEQKLSSPPGDCWGDQLSVRTR